jgi:hypothetical protein
MYPSTNDFDPDYYTDYIRGWENSDDEAPETEVIAGVEIRGFQPEDVDDSEEMPF